MASTEHILVYSLNERLYALDLDAVERVVRAADVTPLPESPDTLLGVVNLQGEIAPVIHLRRRFGLPERAIIPDDHFIVVRVTGRRFVLPVDAVVGVQPAVPDAAAADLLAGMPHLTGVAKLAEDVALVHDLDALVNMPAGIGANGPR